MTNSRPVELIVAVPTLCRPDSLALLLTALEEQVDALSRSALILVIDNEDPPGRQVERLSTATGAHYVHEPQPGLAAVRNRALATFPQADLLVFIDDDEIPEPGWLQALSDCYDRFGCAAVHGPVEPVSEVPITDWLRGTGLYDRQQLPTGMVLAGAATNNLLLDLRVVRRHGLGFDSRFGLTGGEDTMFTHALIDCGEEIRWCAEAVVVEPMAASKLTRRWALIRHFRSGSTWSRVNMTLTRSTCAEVKVGISLMAKSLVKISGAGSRLILALVRNDVPKQAAAICTVASFCGVLAGVFGYSHQEYAKVHRP